MSPARKAGRLGHARRLKGAKVFARVRTAKCSASNRLLVVYAAANDLPYTRLGLMVGRKLGGAVNRNRIKRLLREAFRLEDRFIPSGYDLICIPKPIAEPTLSEYRSGLPAVALRAIERCVRAQPWAGPKPQSGD